MRRVANLLLSVLLIAAAAVIPAAARAQFADQAIWGGTSSGSANAQTLSVANLGGSIPVGVPFRFIAGNSNSGATTLNISSTGAANIFRQTPSGPAALVGGELTAGNIAAVVYDGTRYQLLNSMDLASSTVFGAARVDGTSITASSGTISAPTLNGIKGAAKNLKVVVSSNTAAAITADEIQVSNSSNAYVTLRSVSVTSNTSGAASCSVGTANCLDTGVLGTSAWYYQYVIYNGSAAASLVSASATSPTLPSGYTYFARVGAVRVDGSSNLLRTVQADNQAAFAVTAATNTANLPILASGTAGSVTVPTWVSVATATCVPPTAHSIRGVLGTYNGLSAIAAPNNAYGAVSSITNPPPVASGTAAGVPNNIPFTFYLESSNVFWASNGATTFIACAGWVDSN